MSHRADQIVRGIVDESPLTQQAMSDRARKLVQEDTARVEKRGRKETERLIRALNKPFFQSLGAGSLVRLRRGSKTAREDERYYYAAMVLEQDPGQFVGMIDEYQRNLVRRKSVFKPRTLVGVLAELVAEICRRKHDGELHAGDELVIRSLLEQALRELDEG